MVLAGFDYAAKFDFLFSGPLWINWILLVNEKQMKNGKDESIEYTGSQENVRVFLHWEKVTSEIARDKMEIF